MLPTLAEEELEELEPEPEPSEKGSSRAPSDPAAKLLEKMWRGNVAFANDASVVPKTALSVEERNEYEKKLVTIRRVLLYNRLDTEAPAGEVDRDEHFADINTKVLLYLWASTPSGQSLKSLNIADTIVISKGAARHWFFTSRDGKIKMKNSSRLKENAEIFAAFAKHFPKGYNGIVALVIQHNRQKHPGIGADVTGLNMQDFREFLSQSLMPDCMLQRYVYEPGGDKKLHTASWQEGGHFYVTTTRDFVRTTRVVDGPRTMNEEPCQPTPRERDTNLRTSGEAVGEAVVKSLDRTQRHMFTTKVQLLCDRMVRHIEDTSPQGYVVREMHMHFKHDMRGMIWLMWMSGADIVMSQSLMDNKEFSLNEESAELIDIGKSRPQLQKAATFSLPDVKRELATGFRYDKDESARTLIRKALQMPAREQSAIKTFIERHKNVHKEREAEHAHASRMRDLALNLEDHDRRVAGMSFGSMHKGSQSAREAKPLQHAASKHVTHSPRLLPRLKGVGGVLKSFGHWHHDSESPGAPDVANSLKVARKMRNVMLLAPLAHHAPPGTGNDEAS